MHQASGFRPPPVSSFERAGLNFAVVESLVLKYLMTVGVDGKGRKNLQPVLEMEVMKDSQ